MARIVALLLALAAGAAVALPALAATPAQDALTAARTEARWTGSVSDPTGAAYSMAALSRSTSDACAMPLEPCDTFKLSVNTSDATKLTIAVRADVEDDWVGLSVTRPDGTERLELNESPAEAIVFEKPASGRYVVRVLASPAAPRDVRYAGHARIELPAAAAAAPTPTPSPAPTAAPAPRPQAAAEPAPPPPPPAQPRRRALAVEADRRRVSVAVRKGFRARVVCRGGCVELRMGLFVSSLTAKIYGLGTFKGDVRVGGARTLRDAEGRREVRLYFRRSVRKRLARSRRLMVAVEAVVEDVDGRRRTAVKRILLRG